MHFITFPLTFISLAVRPGILAKSLYFIHLKLPLVDAAICEVQATLAMLLALLILAFVTRTVRPSLNAPPLLFVLDPLASIGCSICMQILTITMSFVILPDTFIDVAVSMCQFALPIGFVLMPLSLVFGAVWPLLRAPAILETFSPLTSVYDIVIKLLWWKSVSSIAIFLSDGVISLDVVISACSHCRGP